MEISFFWETKGEYATPNCISSFVNKDGISLLSCLLTDDGGVPYLDTVPWLNEGIARVRAVRSGTLDFADWSRDAWGVESRNNEAKIYSLHNEDYTEILDMNVFEKLLATWIEFIQSDPVSGCRNNIKI